MAGRLPFSLPAGRAWIWLAATALLYGCAAAAVYAWLDRDTLEAALSMPPSLVVALLALSLVNYAVRGWRWIALCRSLGLRVPLAKNLLYYLAGYSLTSTPGKAGEAVRLWFLKSGHSVPYLRSFPLVISDRALDMWAVLILALASMAGFADYLWQTAALAVIVAAVSLPIVFPRRFEPVLRLLHVLAPRRGRLLVRARRLIRSMDELSNWRTYGLTLIPSLAGWLAEAAALFLLLRHFGADVGFLDAVFVFCFSMIVGAASMLPGGLGSTELTMVVLLGALGVDVGVALAATAIIRVTTFWFAVAIGVALTLPAVNTAARSASAAGSA